MASVASMGCTWHHTVHPARRADRSNSLVREEERGRGGGGG
eukprot:COSAG03_NODE_16414_length_402_cov_1.481848_1_plen_40_part_01